MAGDCLINIGPIPARGFVSEYYGTSTNAYWTTQRMQVKRIFVASAKAAAFQAKQFIEGCKSDDIVFLPWWDGELQPGATILQRLDEVRTRIDGAIVVLTPDMEASIRKSPIEVPNLNVLIEFGFLYGSLAHDRVAIVKYGDYYLPSDLGGYIHIFGARGFRRNQGNPPSRRTKNEFQSWIKQWKNW